MRLLVIEDEKALAGFLVRGLREQHYAVDVAYSGDQGRFLAETNPYDLIVLDWMLPGQDGLSICSTLRKKHHAVPILILTAKDDIDDKVKVLDAGADDYLTKPFAFKELLARIRVLLRRQTGAAQKTLRVDDLELDLASHLVSRSGRPIELTATEYALLEFLVMNTGAVVTRTMISEHVWNDTFDSYSNIIDVYVNYLRNKIDAGFSHPLIHTVRGSGYKLTGKAHV